MHFLYSRILMIISLLLPVYNSTKANDSDVANCSRSFTLVVLGSSTTFGYGATPIDSSWFNQYDTYVKRKNPQNIIINFGKPGFTTYDVLCPNGFIPPFNRPFPDTEDNITAAIKLHPDGILINLPSTDIANNFSNQEIRANYERMMYLADSAKIPVWIATPQPRTSLNTQQRDSLILMRDWTNTRFGNRSIDFWSTLANPDGSIVTAYNFDDTHVNNVGHDILYQRVAAKTILDYLCNPLNHAPVAEAGIDQTIQLPLDSSLLNGNGSFDTDGNIAHYQWRKINGPDQYSMSDSLNQLLSVNNLVHGLYNFELTVTDNYSSESRDTVSLTVNNLQNNAPIANAGNDTSINLPAHGYQLDGTASTDIDGIITSYQWRQISGPQTLQLTNPNNAITTFNNIAEGSYAFELLVTDNNGDSGKDTINIHICSRILIDIGLTPTPSPDLSGKYWNNMTSAKPGIQLQNAITTDSTITPVYLEVINRIDGNFNFDGPGENTGNTIGDVGDYPATATTDYAFAYQGTTNGKWKFGGLDSTKFYRLKFWGAKSLASLDERIIQIKRTDEITWHEYDAYNNTDYNNAIVFTFSGKTEISFDIRAKTLSAFAYISVVDISYINDETSSNIAPIAIAGNDTTLILPSDSLTLDGSRSSDPNGNIINYKWVKISGPAGAQIVSPNAAITQLKHLVEGMYTFELRVIDNFGAVTRDTMIVHVVSIKRILIDIGPTTTSSPDNTGKYWNNMTSAQQGVQVLNAVTTTNLITPISLEVVNRIDGTFNTAGPGVNTGNSIGSVGEYPATATTDYAFADTSATNGNWKFTGLDSLKQYTIKFWGTKSLPLPDQRIIQIKRSDETNWQEYDAYNNTDYNNAALFTFSGKSTISFDIRVKSLSAFGYINIIDITDSTIACSPVSPSVSISNLHIGIICSGTDVTFKATPVNGGATPSFQWKLNGFEITDATDSILNINYLSNNDTISCVLNSSSTCASSLTATSNSLVINVKNSTSSTTSVSTCGNYIWNDNTYSASGVYSFLTNNSVGCDSTATLILTVNDKLTISINSTKLLCQENNNGMITITPMSGSGPYHYSLNSLTPQQDSVFSNLAAGTYSLQIADANGCSVDTSAVIAVELAYWTGSIDSDWHNAGNWSTGSIPTSTTHVIVPATTNSCTISNADAQAASVEQKNGAVINIINNRVLLITGTCTTLPHN